MSSGRFAGALMTRAVGHLEWEMETPSHRKFAAGNSKDIQTRVAGNKQLV